MLDQRQRRWADVVQMLYKCFVFAGWNVLTIPGRGTFLDVRFIMSNYDPHTVRVTRL